MNCTTGQAIEKLRLQQGLRITDLAQVLNINPTLLGKIIKGKRELSFLVALRLLKRFDLSIESFSAMLSEKELNRTDLSTIRFQEKRELREARDKKLQNIAVKDVESMSGKDLTAMVLSHIQNNGDIKSLEQILRGQESADLIK